MKRVLVTALSFSKYDPAPRELLDSAGCHVSLNPFGRPLTEAEMAELVREFDALIVGVDPVTERVLTAGSRLKVVAKHGVGLDNVDLKAATARRVAVTNAPNTNSEAVADLTFGLMLAAARQIPSADRSTREGGWQRFVGPELYGKELGILGLGAIGKAVARRAVGFSMETLAYDVVRDEEFSTRYGVRYANLEEVLGEADFISVNLPLLSETRGILDARALALMKPSAYLVNTARGELIDERALYTALKDGRLAGAALDAYSTEPPGKDHPLLSLPNVVVTPHIGAYTFEANRRMGLTAAQNVLAVLAGKRGPNQVT